MKITGFIWGDHQREKPIAELQVLSDEAEQCGEDLYKRKITGEVININETWKEFIDSWAWEITHQEDGKDYFLVRGIDVNYDFYPFESWVSFDGITQELSLIVFEPFTGTSDDYKNMVQSRNEGIDNYIKKIEHFLANPVSFTRNDIREFLGKERLDIPELNKPVNDEPAFRELLQDALKDTDKTRNMIA